MKISLIVPIYNESKTVDAMIDQLQRLPGNWEVLLADGGSSDDTLARIAHRFPVVICPKGRANQMNCAARMASGEYLWFVHCDSRLPADAYDQLCRAAAEGARWGCFHIAFDSGGLFMRCNSWLSNCRARRGIAFGDQGIFVSRNLFLELGGFPALPIMEDYELSRQMGCRRIPVTVLPGRIITSGRRYRAGCPLVTMWQMFYLRCLYRWGVDIHEIARRYRDIR